MSLLAWTLSFLRPHRGRVAVITALAVVEVGFGALAPWPLKTVVDNVLGGQPLPAPLAGLAQATVGTNVVALLFVVVVAGLLLQLMSEVVMMLHTQLQVNTGQRILYDLRARLLDHLLALGLRHHVVTRTADSVYRLEADAYCVNDLAIGGIFPLTTAALKLIVMFAILARLDPSLALLSLSVVPFLYACLRYYSTRMVDRAERVKQLESSLVERMFEILSSIRVVKSFAREPHELARFNRVGEETMQARLRLTWQESFFAIALSAITLVGTALILTVGGMHVLDGTLTVGGLLVVLAYLAAVYNPLSSIAHTTGSLQQAVVSARRVREILALTPETLDADAGLDAAHIRGELRFDRVSFAYDESRADSRRGELRRPARRDGGHRGPDRRRQDHAGQPDPALLRAHRRAGADRRRRGLALRAAFAARADRARAAGGRALRRLDCRQHPLRPARTPPTPRSRPRPGPPTSTTSWRACRTATRRRWPRPAARSRAANVSAWASRARCSRTRRILILDEPTSSLDAISEEAVFSALRTLRQGRTTIVIAHRLSTIRDADRILVLHEGRLIAQGTHDELLTASDLYARMCARLSVGRSLDEPESVDELLHAI